MHGCCSIGSAAEEQDARFRSRHPSETNHNYTTSAACCTTSSSSSSSEVALLPSPGRRHSAFFGDSFMRGENERKTYFVAEHNAFFGSACLEQARIIGTSHKEVKKYVVQVPSCLFLFQKKVQAFHSSLSLGAMENSAGRGALKCCINLYERFLSLFFNMASSRFDKSFPISILLAWCDTNFPLFLCPTPLYYMLCAQVRLPTRLAIAESSVACPWYIHASKAICIFGHYFQNYRRHTRRGKKKEKSAS